jgi:hypothetical protein
VRLWDRPLGRGVEYGRPGAPAARIGGALLARDPSAAARWLAGANGERLTALALRPLTLMGAVILHNRRLPGQRTDADHTVFSPMGSWYIDSKMWSGDAYSVRGGRLYRQEREVDFSSTAREAMTIRGWVGCKLGVLVCVHGIRGLPLEGLRMWTPYGPVVVVSWAGMLRQILTGSERLDRQRVDRYVRSFQRHFAAY